MTTCTLTESTVETGEVVLLPATTNVPAMRVRIFEKPERNSLPVVLTTVVWTSCLVIGVLGFVLPYLRPQAPQPEPSPLIAQKLEVQLTSEPIVLEPLPPRDPSAAPPPPDAVAQPQLPTPVAVAQPSAAIAFAVPVEGPVRIVEAKRASYSPAPVATNTAPVAPALVPRGLTYGQGEGKQPSPDYPRQAIREGQEGIVMVTFTVDSNGRVLSAAASKPSPWSLLNESAVRAVRSRWRFQPGPARAYEVAINFTLKK